MQNPYAKFNLGIKWNTFEAVTYQTVLTIHHLFLFSKLDYSTFGLIGTFFSILYISIMFLNFGFDKSIAPFFIEFFKSKNTFKKYFVSQFLIQTFILVFVGASIIIFNNLISSFFNRQFNCCYFNKNIWFIFCSLICLESIKKTFRTLCQMAFLNKECALIEVSTLLIYLISVWGIYLLFGILNIYTILLPFIFQSTISVSLLSFLVLKLYLSLPSSKQKINIYLKRIIFNRTTNYLNQLSHMLFSGNIFIIVFARLYGFQKIGILKLANIVAVFFTVILERVFGFTSSALLSNLKDSTLKQKRHAFYVASEKLIYVLYGIFIFLIINYQHILRFLKYKNVIYPTEGWISAFMFMQIILFENFFITFDQLFIIEEKVYYFVFLNSLSALVFYLFVYFNDSSLLISLIGLLIIRFLAFLITQFISFYIWKIKIPYKIKFRVALFYFLFSLIFFLSTR